MVVNRRGVVRVGGLGGFFVEMIFKLIFEGWKGISCVESRLGGWGRCFGLRE